MSTETVIPSESKTHMQQATDNAVVGLRDPEAMRRASVEMDRIGEEVRRRHGVLDISVPSIRELRDR
jgi:hypothetical protein